MAESKDIHAPRDDLTADEADSRFFSIGQAARLLGVSVRTLERHRSAGRLVPARRTPGGHARYSAAQLAQLTGTPIKKETPAEAYRAVQAILARRRIGRL